MLIDRSGAEITSDMVFGLVQKGKYFSYNDWNASIDIATPLEYLLVPTKDWVIMAMGIGVTDATLIEAYENTVTSADGAAQALVNNNRYFKNRQPPINLFKAPTVTTPGDEIISLHTGGIGEKKADVPGAVELKAPWVLEKDVKYLVRLTVEVDATGISIIGGFTEDEKPVKQI